MGIVGGNGAGKSTLFKMIMKQEAPDSGEFRAGLGGLLGKPHGVRAGVTSSLLGLTAQC